MTEIRHIDLEKPPSLLRGEPTPALVVFWWEERPVGQVYATLPREGIETATLVERGVGRAAVEAKAPVPGAERLRTSVVICTRDRLPALERCLESLRGQTLAPDEIIVVDNGSESGAAVRRATEAVGGKWIREEVPGLDRARNVGARAAQGDVIVYTDDDVMLHRRWLERMVAAFETGIDGVTGLVLPADLATEAQRLFERCWGFGRGFVPRDFGPEFFAGERREACPVWKIGAGASMAFRRRVFERVGFFDERLDAGAAGCSGDSEMWHRMLTDGMTIRYAPAAVAFHEHRREMAALRRQIFAYARGHTAALLVQQERSSGNANGRRAWWGLPRYYLGRALRRVFGKRREADRFLGEEIKGWASGLAFYYRTRRGRGAPKEGKPRPGRRGAARGAPVSG